MAIIKSGFNMTVSCSQNSTIQFKCKAKKRPGYKLGKKIDLTTDRSSNGFEYEPSGLIEVTDGEIIVPDDFALEQSIRAILGVKGTITFTATTLSGTQETTTVSNAWFASYTPEKTGGEGELPTAVIVIQASAGTTSNSNSGSSSSAS